MIGTSRAVLLIVSLWVLWVQNAALAQTGLRCGPFAAEAPAPVARGAASAEQRFDSIKRAVKSQPHRILFLGDSLTERFPHDAPEVWRDHMAPRGVLNAGVSGDRTDNLLWRLQHGNLAGPKPAGVVVLIGTNDLTYEHGSRPVDVAAEGVRANLLYLRQRLPRARILLLGLLPRGAAPDGKLRRKTVAVNRMIRECGDGRTIVYADIGGILLDRRGRLTPAIAPDQLHFSRLGYARLTRKLDALIDDLMTGR